MSLSSLLFLQFKHLHMSVQIKPFLLHLHLLVEQSDLQEQTLSSINSRGDGRFSVKTGIREESLSSHPQSTAGGRFCIGWLARRNSIVT